MFENHEYVDYSFEPMDSESSEMSRETPAEPSESGKNPKKRRGGLKVAALALACALVGGVGGGAITAQILRQDNSVPAMGETQPSDDASHLQNDNVVVNNVVHTNTGDKDLTPQEVYNMYVDSVVGITTSGTTTNIFGQISEFAASGSGFVISEDGYIVTNHHVIADASSVKVAMYDGSTYEAQVIGSDSSNDVALLKIDASGLKPVAIGDSDSIAVGDQVAAIGNPLGELTFSLTAGYVSALDRAINTDGTPINMLQTDAAINSGNSGGPLFDMNGNVIGITAAKYSGQTASGTTIEGIGFAIPIDDALRIVYDLQKYGYVTGRAYLGVTVRDLDADTASDYGLPVGPRVESVVMGSCSEKAGIQSGDIILALGGKNTTSTVGLLAALRDHRAGETVEVDLYRAGAELTVSVTLDERPQNLEVTVEEEPQPETLPDGSGN